MIYPALLEAFNSLVWDPRHVDIRDFLPIAIRIGTSILDKTVRPRIIELILDLCSLRVRRIESLSDGTQSLCLYLLDSLLLLSLP